MGNPFFQFKQFTIWHNKCAMKVGTDGVLLGAWANIENCNSFLDIGCGSGLISLMLAQRTNGHLPIDSIDIDKDAVIQTRENIEKSPFKKISVYHTSLQDFSISNKKYDCIVSNPPFFTLSLKSPSGKRTLARHNESLSIQTLFRKSNKLLSEKGKLIVIYPHLEKDNLTKMAYESNLFPKKIANIYPTHHSLPKRILIEFNKTEFLIEEENIVIEQERHIYTPEFISLVKDFYLKL